MSAIRAVSLRVAAVCFAVGMSIVFVALALEVLSSIGAIGSYAAQVGVTTPDERLLVRMQPHAYSEIDANGYRNPEVPDSVDVVVLGDSQTYGYNAASDETWPKVYGELTGRSVYNMGIGSYGPAQYSSLLTDAIALQPKTLLFGFYLGNDLVDACVVFSSLEYWRDFARAEGLDVSDCIEGLPPAVPLPTSFSLSGALGDLELYRRLKKLPLVTALVSQRRDVQIARSRPDHYVEISEPGIETVVMLGRLETMTPEDRAARRGAELTKFFYQSIIDAAPSTEIGVVFIPTKASALYEELHARGVEVSPRFHELVRVEAERIREFSEFFAARGVASVDSTPSVRAKVGLGEPVFMPYADGHPRPIGYRAMAEAAAHAFPGLAPPR